MVDRLVLDLGDIDRDRAADVGGKGVNLGELSRIDGVRVPPGFCVTTAAFHRHVAASSSWDDRLDRLARLRPDDREAIAALSAEVRDVITGPAVPDDVAAAITHALDGDDGVAYAVRSSATAEDLPSASFAGQYDTFLNVVGAASVVEHVRRCWSSLFTERAVTYRLRQGVDHRSVGMGVVVQRMVTPDASGVLFTADPLTGDRRVTSVEAVLGLGEALVSGVADADRWTVRDGVVVDTTVATKQAAVRPTAGGGTTTQAVGPDAVRTPALTEAQVVRLAELGRRIEAHFGDPQDIEWCLVDDDVQVVQSRPITTSFPVPATEDAEFHVYISVGHQQMMIDAMTPLGLSVWQMTTPLPMAEAGGRLFVDVTGRLASPPLRDAFMEMWGQGDPRVRNALQTVLDRGEIVDVPAPEGAAGTPVGGPPAMIDPDPALVADLIARGRESVAVAAGEIPTHHGPELFDAIAADFHELRRLLFEPRSHEVFMTAMNATFWLEEHLHAWLGEEHVADTLTLSVPDNITSQMGLALLDVADVVRRSPQVVAFLRGVREDDPLDGLLELPGGRESLEALDAFLDAYGMRCVGEIDISRPRWSERPGALVPVILGHVDNTEPGAGRRRFEQGREDARAKEQDVLERLRARPDGEQAAGETALMIERLRTFTGYREFPKFGMVSRYQIYRQALLGEAERLVCEGVLGDREDIYYLRFDELHEVARTGRVDGDLVRERRRAFARYRALTPPRVLTSHGESIVGEHRRDGLPAGALAGLPVSRGIVEGRARVVLDLADADLQPGDILVTAFTDPSWSPAFVAAAGLVTEVGGTMTHGAVVAREYGLPAVVGVEGATRRLHDGQRIRVDGTSGWVEVLT